VRYRRAQPEELETLKLIQTCEACPEQYDVEDNDGNTIGYIRLRWGRFRVICPNIEGETVLEHQFSHSFGMFDAHERDIWIDKALKAIKAYWENKNDGRWKSS